MKIKEIIAAKNRTMSFEVFPPKTYDKFDTVRDATEKIAALSPAYMSVTFGAGGTGARYTLPIAANIEQKFGVPVIHHLTCVGSTAENIDEKLLFMKMVGVENVLALRGDLPEGAVPAAWDFRHADELTAHIKKRGDFCIGGACYPEKHPEAASAEEDIANLKKKIDAGCDFLTTQLFLDNSVFYSFLSKLKDSGITVPVTAGIMPITSVKQFSRIVTLSGSAITPELRAIGDRYGDDADSMKAAGVDYAEKQIRDLYENGIKNIHVYTMNDAGVAEKLIGDFSSMLD
ncbi:MAG: methylenetetrahydrofolate reductase [Clostridia bacterium]|nr:methylenetetrahydrofolate reductase [Clostridia bacterium]